MNTATPDRMAGLLLGTAVGDSLGLPAEGLRPATTQKLRWSGNWRHRFLPGRGMWSDDTEHTIMVAQALLRAQGDLQRFARSFAWELRWWIVGLPAGVGLGTARAILKLWLGFPPWRAGVHSAGNGPCMRAAVVGAYFASDSKLRYNFTSAHTKTTHSDNRAAVAALAVADLAAQLSSVSEPPSLESVMETLRMREGDQRWQDILSSLEDCLRSGASLAEFQEMIGSNPKKSVSGYAYHTVPVVIFLGIKNDWEFESTLSQVLDAGGDADSTGAIAGALCGAYGGKSAIPAEWVSGIAEWPTGTRKLERLAEALCSTSPIRIRPRWSPALLARNLFFLFIVLLHGFLRLVPAGLRQSKNLRF